MSVSLPQAPMYLIASTPSTNDLALEAARGGERHGTCWVADAQSAGRGRRQIDGSRRLWHSPAGQNLYLSVLLRPSLPMARAAGLTLAVAAPLCRALYERGVRDVWIKWPNDIWVAERKLGGILTEALLGPDNRLAVVVGLGLNINIDSEAMPEALRDTSTSLKAVTGRRWDRLSLVWLAREAILEGSKSYVASGLSATLPTLRAFDRTRGRKVEIAMEGQWVPGVAQGIGDQGGLCVELADQQRVEVQSGEVRFATRGNGDPPADR